MPETRSVRLDEINVLREREGEDPAELRRLARSIEDNDLLSPPIVRDLGDGRLVVVAGRRRIAAVKLLGWQTIPCFVKRMTDDEAVLAEIDENLQRRELSALERGEYMARRVAVTSRLFPAPEKTPEKRPPAAPAAPRRHDPPREVVAPAPAARMAVAPDQRAEKRAIEEAAKVSGVSMKTAERAVRVGRICEAAREILRGTPWASNQHQLLLLTTLSVDDQVKTARSMVKNKIDVTEALRRRQRLNDRGRELWPAHLDAVITQDRVEMLKFKGEIGELRRRLANYLRSLGTKDPKHWGLQSSSSVLQAVDRDFVALMEFVSDNLIPAALCPYCDTNGCKECGGSGWLPEAMARKAGKEVKIQRVTV